MRAFVRRHPLPTFFVLTYTLSWAYWVPMALGGRHVAPGSNVTHFPGLFGPAVAALIVLALTEGGTGVAALLKRMVCVSRPGVRFWLYSLSPLGFLLLALLIARIGGFARPPWSAFAVYSGLPALGVIPVFALVLLGNGFGEEAGWRGFALEPLQQRFGPLRGTLALGALWAGWHIPAFWIVETYRQMTPAMIAGGFVLGIASGALVLARVSERTQGSVLAVALWHALYNMTSATAASRGIVAAVTTTCVIVWATALLLHEWRHRVGGSILAVHAQPAAAGAHTR